MPGVLAVFVGADIPYNPLPMAWPAGGSAGIQNNVNTPRILATDSVKWTGEGVAAVVAETEAQAYDALDAIQVDWEPLPGRGRRREGDRSPARRSSTRTPRTTSSSSGRVGDKAGTDAAVDGAEVVVRQRLVNQRLIPNPMETRGDIGWYNPGTDEYTVWMSSQTPHIQRLLLDRLRDRHPGAQGPVHQPRRRRRVRHQDLLLRRHGADDVREQGASAGGRSSGSRAAARTTRARSTAATTSPTSRSPASATARSPGCGSRRSPTSAAASRRSARASRRRSTPASCRAATRSRTSTPR